MNLPDEDPRFGRILLDAYELGNKLVVIHVSQSIPDHASPQVMVVGGGMVAVASTVP